MLALLAAAATAWLALDLTYRAAPGELMLDFGSWRPAVADPASASFFANLQPLAPGEKSLRLVLQIPQPRRAGSSLAAAGTLFLPERHYCLELLVRPAHPAITERAPPETFEARIFAAGRLVETIPLPAGEQGRWVAVRGIRPRSPRTTLRFEVGAPEPQPPGLPAEASRVIFEFARLFPCAAGGGEAGG